MNLDDLDKAARAASWALANARRVVDDESRKAANEAREAVRAKHAAEIDALQKASLDARRAHDEALSAAASHPWEGKRVFKMAPGKYGRGKVRADGMVRVRRAGEHPGAANQSYGLPRIGQAYIVPLRTDGSPGVRVIDTFREDGTTSSGWQLAEGES